MIRLAIALTALVFLAPLRAQEAAELHEFTDKKGSKILASLLSVSEDKRTMKIRREDGIEFDLEINILSLDDQQFVKQWMAQAPKTAADYLIELVATRKAGRTEKLDGGSSSYSYERRFSTYDFTVRNLSRETVPPARIEYAIVWDEQLDLFLDDDGNWSYDYPDEDQASTFVKLLGSVEIPSLPFNREETVTTEAFPVDRMFLLGDLYREDEALGVVARVVASDGTVLAETKFGKAEVERAEWESVIAFSDPRTR